MKRHLCAILTALLLTAMIPAAAAQSPSGLESVKGIVTTNTSVSVENSVVDAAISFSNVPQSSECTLRWYIDDTLCAEDPHFLLEEGSGASMQASVHFGDTTGEAVALWVELQDNTTRNTARYCRRIFVRDFQQPVEWPKKEEYEIHVIRNQCLVVVYRKDADWNYNQIANAFVCSTGVQDTTETGTFGAYEREDWKELIDSHTAQYPIAVHGDLMLYSAPYYSCSKNALNLEAYNQLGQNATAGCVHMAAADIKWIYDHCPYGTRVRLYDSDVMDVVRPVPIRLNPETFTGWDPTDPDIANPTRPKYFPDYNTALRPVGNESTTLSGK